MADLTDHPPSGKGVTLQAIADAVGVSRSTVSRAFSGHPSIPEATRQKIRQLAAKLGYTPDATMNEMMFRVRSGRSAGFQETLGLLFCTRRSQDLIKDPHLSEYVQGIEARAHQLGYACDRFWLEENPLRPKTLGKILKTRGIRGCVLMVPERSMSWESMPWPEFAWVALGFDQTDPPLHIVTPDWYGDAVIATRRLHDQGLHRVGMVWEPKLDPLLGNAWIGGYASTRVEVGLPPILFRAEGDSYSRIGAWAKTKKLQAVMTHTEYILRFLPSTRVQCVLMNVSDTSETKMGIRTACRDSGINAVDVLVGQLSRRELGIPSFQKKIRSPGRWTESRSHIAAENGSSVAQAHSASA